MGGLLPLFPPEGPFLHGRLRRSDLHNEKNAGPDLAAGHKGDGHSGKCELTTAAAQRVSELTRDFCEQWHPPDLAVCLTQLRAIPQRDAGGAASLVRRHATT